MATNSDIGVSQPAASTITMKVRTVTQSVNSTTVHQEVLTIGGAESTLEIVRVTTTTPDSTAYGLVTRSVIYPGDPILVDAVSQLATDYWPVRMVDSSGTGFASLGIDYTDGSTTSTLAAGALSYVNGSNTTMRVVGTTQPLPVQLRTSAGTELSASTGFVAGSTAALLDVRPSVPSLYSVSTTVTSTASTAFYELLSSNALSRRVCAYLVTSTAAAAMSVEFMSGTNTTMWGLDIGSGSSGVTGANLAVPGPAYLFATAAGAAVNLRLGSTGVQVRVSFTGYNGA